MILMMVAIISTQLTLILFLWISDDVYELDSCLNIYCVWLTFRFSEKYYNSLCCGKMCVRTCFPCVKAIAVGCDRDGNKITCKNTRDACCCCCINSQYKEYYLLSKEEYKLFILNNSNNKSRSNSITPSTYVVELGQKYTLDEPLL